MKKIFLGLVICIFCLVSVTYAANVTLTWTAPADEGNTNATAYRLVYSYNGTITEANFNNATVIATSVPKAPGATESILANLTDGRHYWFAVKSQGKSGLWSTISNVVQANFFVPSPITDLSAN